MDAAENSKGWTWSGCRACSFRLLSLALLLTALVLSCARFNATPGIFGLLLLPGPLCSVNRPAALGSWTKRRPLTLLNSGRSALINFPVLVALDSSRIDYSSTQNSGQDLRFVDNDGVTILSHEIESWNEAGTSYVWVSIPQVEAFSSLDCIWMYYGNASAADAQNASGVWDSNFSAVWHFNGSFNDSTSAAANGVNNGSTSAAGKFANGLNFNGTSGYVQTPVSLKTVNNYTISLWFRSGDTVNPRHLVWQGPATENGWGVNDTPATLEMHLSFSFVGGAPANCLGYYYGYVDTVGSTQTYITQANGAFTDTTNWNHLAVSVQNAGSAPFASLYLNGNLIGSASGTQTNRAAWNTNLRLARPGVAQRFYQGDMDEVSVQNTARDASWIGAQYASQTDSFLTFGAQE